MLSKLIAMHTCTKCTDTNHIFPPSPANSVIATKLPTCFHSVQFVTPFESYTMISSITYFPATSHLVMKWSKGLGVYLYMYFILYYGGVLGKILYTACPSLLNNFWVNEWHVRLNHIILYIRKIVDQIIFAVQLTVTWFLKKTHGKHFWKQRRFLLSFCFFVFVVKRIITPWFF